MRAHAWVCAQGGPGRRASRPCRSRPDLRRRPGERLPVDRDGAAARPNPAAGAERGGTTAGPPGDKSRPAPGRRAPGNAPGGYRAPRRHAGQRAPMRRRARWSSPTSASRAPSMMPPRRPVRFRVPRRTSRRNGWTAVIPGGLPPVLARRDTVHRGRGQAALRPGLAARHAHRCTCRRAGPLPARRSAAPGHRGSARQGPRPVAERLTRLGPRSGRSNGSTTRPRSRRPGWMCSRLPARHFADVIGNPGLAGQAPRTQSLRHRTLTRAAGRDGMSTKTGAGDREGGGGVLDVTAGSPGRRPREHRIAEEQAALRRVATLVARAAPPEEVFAAVTAEAGRLLDADHAA